jgi:preprotein translocase subunit SecY
MIEMLQNAMRAPDLRKRIVFVFAMFAVYVVGLHIPCHGINHDKMEELFASSGLLSVIDLFTGGALRKFSIFAMGIMPYITASIMLQLLVIALPQLEELTKQGEFGRRKINRYTRYLTVLICVVQGFFFTLQFRREGILTVNGFLPMLELMLTLTAGTCFLIWLGEMITEKGVGNGISLIIFVGIVARMPSYVLQTIEYVQAGTINLFQLSLFLAVFISTIAGVVYVTQGQRKIPIQHAQRTMAGRTIPGQRSFLPLKVNIAGVMPIIFALAILQIPEMILNMLGNTAFFNPAQYPDRAQTLAAISKWLAPGAHWFGSLLYFVMIIIFTYFYTSVIIKVPEIAENLKKHGSFIPGIRPGKPTVDYLDKVVSRITLAGACFLGVIALAQYYVPHWTGVVSFTGIVGGTSLLIMVGVALDTMQQIEAHLLMRHYEGFIK